ADHAHTMSFSGYPRRGNNILSTTPDHDMKYSYSTLGYMNGPSAKSFQDAQNHHFENDNMMQHDYRFPSLFQLEDETHGGDA
ncbi:alkaline phosphatase, partial [bacterium LRH843]|nr:alkaline phosphatase [bacterium LRH843]